MTDSIVEWLCKGAGHKYRRRIPTGDPKRKWRYIYAAQSKHHDSEFSAGEKIRITHGKQVGHYEVKSLHGAYVTLKHDETGHEVSVHKDRLAQMFKDEHRRAGAGQRKMVAKTAAKAKAAAVAQEAYEASKQAKTSTGSSHERAAELHTKAADAGAEHAALHRELAVAHKRTAQTIHARAKAKLPKQKFVLRLERRPKPGYLGTKQQAWDALMDSISGETPGDFHTSDAKYQEWKRRGGRKPPPYTGGELDTVNDALGLFAPDRGERLRGKKDPRVSSLREGFERLTSNIKRWDDPRMRDAIDALRGVDGLSRVRVPGGKAGGGATRGRRVAKEQEAYYREVSGQALDTSFDPDEVEASPDFDTSFDFGFNAEAAKSMSNDAINDIGEYLEKAYKYDKRTGTPGNYRYEYQTAGGQKVSVPSQGAVATQVGERKQAEVKEKRGFSFGIPGTKMSVSAQVDRKMGRRTTYTLHIVGPNQLRTGAKISAEEESGKLIHFEATSTRGTDVKPVPTKAMDRIKEAFQAERDKIREQAGTKEGQGKTPRDAAEQAKVFDDLTPDQQHVLTGVGQAGSYTTTSDSLAAAGIIERDTGALTDKGRKLMATRVKVHKLVEPKKPKESKGVVGKTESGKPIPREPKPAKHYGDWTSADHASASRFFEGKESPEGHGSDMRNFHSAMMTAKMSDEVGQPSKGVGARSDAARWGKRARAKLREYSRSELAQTQKSDSPETDQLKKSMTIRKSLDESESLDKSYGRVDEWADQFRGTPLYRKALQLTKDKLQCEKDRGKATQGHKSWSSLEDLPRPQRRRIQAQQQAVRDKHNAREEELEAKCKSLEEELIDHRLEYEKGDGDLYRSDDAISALSESLEKGKALPSDTASVSPTKARQILHDGEVHGKPITDQQRKFFGAIGGHLPAPGKEARKSMDSIDAMEEFAKGHGATVGETVTGSPQKNFGEAGALPGDNAAGAGPLPRKDADGGAGLGSGTTGRPPAPNTSGESPGGKLSEDDEVVEEQMTDRPAPGQQRRGSQLMMGRYRKSVIEGVGDTGGRMNPGVQLESQSYDRAVEVSRLLKNDDVAFGASEPQTEEGVQVYEKATHKRVGDLVHMSDVSDLEVERMQKASDFYHGAPPDVGVAANLRKSQPCVGGGDHRMSAHLTTCDTCGAGRSGGYIGAGIELQKSGRGLARPHQPDLDMSKGLTFDDEE